MKPFAIVLRLALFGLFASALVIGCGSRRGLAGQTQTLPAARRGFKTRLVPANAPKDPVEQPPPSVFRAVSYPAPGGSLAAYLTPDAGDGKKRPAMVWITGGDCNSIGDVWSPASPDNDQTAAQYRKAGIVMLFPSLRGGNTNPGAKEGFLGEVDDVIAVADYLARQPYVDPKRIYLGGHSTGGTLALLVAESSPRFRATFAFGPVADVSGYGDDSGFLPFDTSSRKEIELRSPGYWLSSIHSPVWVIEGAGGQSNIESVRAMEKINANPQVHFVEVGGATHFSVLAPTNTLIAQKIVADTGAATNIGLESDEASRNFALGGSRSGIGADMSRIAALRERHWERMDALRQRREERLSRLRSHLRGGFFR